MPRLSALADVGLQKISPTWMLTSLLGAMAVLLIPFSSIMIVVVDVRDCCDDLVCRPKLQAKRNFKGLVG